MATIETPKKRTQILSPVEDIIVNDSAFNQKVLEAEREYQEKIRIRKKAHVESGGLVQTPSYSDSVNEIINKNSQSPQNLQIDFSSKTLKIVNDTIEDVYRPIHYSSSSATSTSSDSYKLTDVDKTKIYDDYKESRLSYRGYMTERRLANHGIRTIRTYNNVVQGLTRSAIRNDENSGLGLTQVYDNGLEIVTRNPVEAAKLMGMGVSLYNPAFAMAFISANMAKNAIINAEISSYATRYSSDVARQSLNSVNNKLQKYGYNKLDRLNRNEINGIMENVKSSDLSDAEKRDLLNELGSARNWGQKLDLEIAKRDANQILRRNGIQTLNGHGTELNIQAKRLYRKLLQTNTSQEVLDSIKKIIDISNAETLKKSLLQKYEGPARFVKGVTHVLGRYMRKTDFGRGLVIVVTTTRLTSRAIKKSLHLSMSLTREAINMSRRAFLASLQKNAEKLRATEAKIQKLNISEADRHIDANKKLLDKRDSLRKRNERLEKRNSRYNRRNNKIDDIKNKLRDPFGLRSRYNAFKTELRRKALRKILGERGYAIYTSGLGVISKIKNLFAGFMRKILAYAAALVLLLVVIAVLIMAVSALIGSFDLSGDSNYAKIKKYVCELYRDDIRFMAMNHEFTECDGTSTVPLGCTNLIFDNSTHINMDKYKELIDENTDDEFNHNATSNICEIMSMTYVHFEQEFGDEVEGSTPEDIFDAADYADLRDYVLKLWRGSHHFDVTYSGSTVTKIKYTTYFFDDIFACKLRTDRWITENRVNNAGNSSGYQIWKALKAQGFSDVAAAGVMGCWDQEAKNSPYTVESDFIYLKTDAEKDAVVETKDTLDAYSRAHIKVNDHYLADATHYACGVGLAQWTAGRAWKILYYYDEEKDDLSANRSKAIDKWMNLDYQMSYLNYEVTKDPYYSSLLSGYKDIDVDEDASDEEIRAATDKATDQWLVYYEGCARNNRAYPSYLPPRQEAAFRIYNTFHNMNNGDLIAYGQGSSYGDHIQHPGSDLESYSGTPWHSALVSTSGGGNTGYCGMCGMASLISSMTGKDVSPLDMCATENGVSVSQVANNAGCHVAPNHPSTIADAYNVGVLCKDNADREDIMNGLKEGAYISMHISERGAGVCKLENGNYITQYMHWITIFNIVDEDKGIVLISTSSGNGTDKCFSEMDIDNVIGYYDRCRFFSP